MAQLVPGCRMVGVLIAPKLQRVNDQGFL